MRRTVMKLVLVGLLIAAVSAAVSHAATKRLMGPGWYEREVSTIGDERIEVYWWRGPSRILETASYGGENTHFSYWSLSAWDEGSERIELCLVDDDADGLCESGWVSLGDGDARKLRYAFHDADGDGRCDRQSFELFGFTVDTVYRYRDLDLDGKVDEMTFFHGEEREVFILLDNTWTERVVAAKSEAGAQYPSACVVHVDGQDVEAVFVDATWRLLGPAERPGPAQEAD